MIVFGSREGQAMGLKLARGLVEGRPRMTHMIGFQLSTVVLSKRKVTIM